MSKKLTSEELKQVGENCSQYQPAGQSTTAAMGTIESEGVSCVTCRHWSGSRCIINVFDNVAVNLGILPEE